MIFVLAAEILTRMVLKAQEAGLLNGFLVNPNSTGILILQFADDTLIFTNGTVSEAKVVKNILLWFEACSVLKVNTKKTVLYKVNTVDMWDEVLEVWKSKEGFFRILI